jgi:DNA-binding PadR family transcriptional regulator
VKEPTTTSFAILGLLAIKPWSAYDLAQQMTRGFAWYWPRAERAIYAEPKFLVERGYAKVETAHRGQHARSVYSITPAGRRALRKWLADPSALPHLESEALVRLTFLEHGSIDDAATALAAFTSAADQLEAIVHRVSTEYIAGRGPFPHRIREVALTGRSLFELATMFRAYAAWATGYLAAFEEGSDENALQALRVLNEATRPADGGSED